MQYIWRYQFLFGAFTLVSTQDALNAISFQEELSLPEAIHEETPVLKQAAAQMAEYFAGQRKTFTIPLAPKGTEFQKRVWQALCDIPYGETRCYADIAAAIGNPKASRAVGMANNRNPLMIVIPCHRVIGRNGALTGYAGGLDLKQKLLCLEQGKQVL